MANSKSNAKRKAQVAARSAHVQQKSGGQGKSTPAGANKKQTATRKNAPAPAAPAPKGPAARVRAVATRTNKPAKTSSTGKIEPKTGKLKPGDKAPAFSGKTADGTSFSLRQALSAKGNKGAVVYFYPKAGSPGCTSEACDFRDSEKSLEAAGYSVVGISPDEPEALAKFASSQKLPFTLISDPDHKIAQKYGVWDDGHRLGVKVLGQKSRTRRSTFVIDAKGKLVYARYDVKAAGHVARLKQALALV